MSIFTHGSKLFVNFHFEEIHLTISLKFIQDAMSIHVRFTFIESGYRDCELGNEVLSPSKVKFIECTCICFTASSFSLFHRNLIPFIVMEALQWCEGIWSHHDNKKAPRSFPLDPMGGGCTLCPISRLVHSGPRIAMVCTYFLKYIYYKIYGFELDIQLNLMSQNIF